MTRHRNLKNLFIAFLFIFSASSINAEIIQDKDFGFILDIPEGYKIENYTEDGMSYIFSHPNIPVTFVMKIYYDPSYTKSADVLKMALGKLSAKTDIDTFKWSGQSCSISSFSMSIDQTYKGWAVCAPVKIQNAFVTLLCYAPEKQEAACEQFIMSTLNSLCIDDYQFNIPGIITSYAFPSEGKKNINLQIDGKQIATSIDKADVEAADFTVELEYAVLTLYAKHNLWKEAWQRYYRMIYRDSYGRLQKVSQDIYKTLYPYAESNNPSNADITYAQMLLTWTQNFNYQRAKTAKASDFTSLPAMLNGTGNDCDSRSMLLCVLLKSCGIDSILLFSPEYSHAIAATDITAPGQTYKLKENGKDYIFGETTAKVTWGMIAQEHNDRSKWIPVIFP